MHSQKITEGINTMDLSGPVSSRTRASTKRRTKAVYNDCLKTFSEAIEQYKCEMKRQQDMYNDFLQTFTNAIEQYRSEK